MAFCGCFKSNHQLSDNANSSTRRGKGNRQSIIKNKEMDLLDMNKRGMDGPVPEEEEWVENDDNNDDNRVSHQTDMLMSGKDFEENKVSQTFALPSQSFFRVRTLRILAKKRLTTS